MLWAPYLMGERTPHLRSRRARARSSASRRSHTRGHVVRAVLEGVAFSLRDTFTIFAELGVPVQQHPRRRRRRALAAVARDSGGRRTATPVETVAAEEGAAYGAAILAGVGAGVWPTVDEACDAVVHDGGATTDAESGRPSRS